jgi:hypothetical protein
MSANQEAYLSAFALVGSVKKACEATGIARQLVSYWSVGDKLGFKDRYAAAREDFREGLQDIAVARVKDQAPGDNPALLIKLLEAHWPDKYRRAGYIADGTAKEMIDGWRKFVRDGRSQAKARKGEGDRHNAVEEAERILARKSKRDDTDGAAS